MIFRRALKWAPLAAALLLAVLPQAEAQTTAAQVTPGSYAAPGDLGCPATSPVGCFIPYSVSNPLPVNASVTASISGFTAASTGAPISVTTGGVTGTLPIGAVVVATNVGTTNGAYCKLGASSTISDQYLAPGGGWFAFTVLANTQLTCITSTSTTTVNMVGGAGLPTGVGGNGVAAGGATAANQATEIASLATIATNTGAAIPAGTNLIGKVGIDQTTPGTTNGVALVGVNGATALAGNGTTGTGSLRVTIASDNSAVAGMAVGATGAAVPANAVSNGFNAQSAEPAKATTGNLTAAFGDLTGKLVTSPYANRESMVRGSVTGTDTAAHTIIAAGGASVKTYITDIECGRSDTGTAAIILTFSDAAATILVLPNSGGGGGNNKTFNVPLVTAANTAFTFTSGTSTSTVYCSAQGFSGY